MASFCLARLLALEESSLTWASPHLPPSGSELILRIATENTVGLPSASLVSCVRLGFDVSARTVSRYRQQALRRPP